MRPRRPATLGALMLSLALATWLLGSCATLPGAPQVGELPSPAQAIQRLEERRQAVRSLVLQGEISLSGAQGEFSGEALIQGQYPDRLRVEVSGPFGRPVLSLISNGAWLIAVDYQAGRAYAGRASRRNLARFLGLALSLREVYALLSGAVPLLARPEESRLTPGPEPGQATLHLLGAGGTLAQEIVFALRDYTVLGGRLRQWGQAAALRVRFGDFAPTPQGLRFPYRISLQDRREREVSLLADSVVINQPLDGVLFEPQLPGGVPVERLP